VRIRKVLAAAMVGFVLVPAVAAGPAAGASTCSGPPVAVLPDFASGTKSASALATRLRAIGRCPRVLAYGRPRLLARLAPSVRVPLGGMDAIDRMVAEIAPALTTLAGTMRTVDVVGVGIGSLVALRYQQIAGQPVTIRRHVALGALWHGTNLAGLGNLEQLSRDAGTYDTVLTFEKLLVDGLCASCREMLAGSDFMRALAQAGLQRPGTSVTSIISRTDGLVSPYTSGALPGTTTIVVQDRFPDLHVGHFGLPHNASVLDLVADALRQ
jgi:triacylglycerol lipase